MIRLSNSLLDLAKASYDQTEISFKPIRLDEVLLDARNDVLHNQLTYKVAITFEKDIDNDDYISVKGNEYLLKVAFINLIENGCKFSDNKKSTVAISYTNSHISIRFSDSGMGIGPEELQHIFTPFYRGRNKNISGNGIGLGLTKKIIEQHNGTITAQSVLQEGTTFTVTLKNMV